MPFNHRKRYGGLPLQRAREASVLGPQTEALVGKHSGYDSSRHARRRGVQAFAGLLLALLVSAPGCGGSDSTQNASAPVMDAPDGSTLPPTGNATGIPMSSTGLSIDPPDGTLRVTGTTLGSLQLTAFSSFASGAPTPVTATFSVDSPSLGTIDSATGVFTTTNAAGGVATVTARYDGKTANARITIVLDAEVSAGKNVPSGAAAFFDASKNRIVTDDSMRTPSLIYPVPETMFPQNIAHVLFQWRAAGAKLFQLRFQSDVLDYKIYTDGTDETCAAAGTGAGCFQSDEHTWTKLAVSNAGQAVKLTVSATDPSKPGTVYQAAPVVVRFSKSSVPGAIYYWSTTVAGIRRGRLNDLTPTNFLTPAQADGHCVACHTLSRDGKRMAADVNWQNLWVVDVTKEVPPRRRIQNYQGNNIPSAWATFGPEARRIVSAREGGALILRDGETGAPIGANDGRIDLKGNNATMPDWSPDGSLLVFAMGPGATGRGAVGASIGLLSGNVKDDSFSNLQTIVAANGDNNIFPMVDPSNRFIAFVKGKGGSEGDSTAQVYVVRAEPGSTPQQLTRADTLVNDKTETTGLFNNMPTWAPAQDDGIEWVAFTSSREYGVVLGNGSRFGRKRQLWIAAVDTKKIGAGDPSYPAFHVPFQELNENAHRPFWAEDALVAECVDANGDCTKGSCCAGLACTDVGDAKQCTLQVQ